MDPAEQWAAASARLWADLGGPDGVADVTRTGVATGLASPLPVGALAVGAVSAAGRAAAVLHGADPERVVVDAARVGSSLRADQLIRIAGATPPGFAPLSGFFRAADGWVRTHANYPHHRARLVEALGTDDVAVAVARLPALDVEDAVTRAGGIAVAVRTRREWTEHDQGRAVAAEPLVAVRRTGVPGPAPSPAPRVLDLTRVIAGPVATRTLALAGADVLRVDPPGLDEIAAQHADTGIGKRSTVLDARDERFADLLRTADVLVIGYRPDGLAALGLTPDALHTEHPHLVIVRLDAWGWTGPWALRRGFDSIVQAACGIADLHRTPDRPGALPAQALDHVTGYLAAASAMLGLSERERSGGSVRDLSLARTAEQLCTMDGDGEVSDQVPPVRQRLGDDEVPPPAFTVPGGSGLWAAPAHLWGSAEPAWRS